MITLTLQQAAALLKIHPVTLQDKARVGAIPGAKIGKFWVFVETVSCGGGATASIMGAYLEKCHEQTLGF